jgi:hypothetical protein
MKIVNTHRYWTAILVDTKYKNFINKIPCIRVIEVIGVPIKSLKNKVTVYGKVFGACLPTHLEIF